MGIAAIVQTGRPMCECNSGDIRPVALNYWAGHNNFGDELSPYIIGKITNRAVVHAESNKFGKLVGIGSIINHHNAYSDSYIWGSGLLTRGSIKRRLLPFKRLFFKSKVLAARGPLTAQVLSQRGFDFSPVYGDPALLMPLFYTPESDKSGRRIGLVLHQRHSSMINEILLADAEVKLISIYRAGERQIESFVNEVTSCEKVYSTSLHGIIIAQAYGIPAQWISFDGVPIHADEDFKFLDYFIGANQEIQRKILLNSLSPENLGMMKKHQPLPVKKFLGERQLLDMFPHGQV